jgi:hypothetical protein
MLIIIADTFAQPPEKMSYQAVIRNSSNQLVTNTNIGMQINILKGSNTGTAVYIERHFPTTNENGLVSIEIGEGTIVSGSFSAIDWKNGTYFIKTEVDLNGGDNYIIEGTSQILSVPYALHAKTAETVTGTITETDPVYSSSVTSGITATDTANWNNKQEQLTDGIGIRIVGNTISATGGCYPVDFYLGQDTLGGIVYYIYISSDGKEHGLVVSKTESNAKWQNTTVLNNANHSWDGAYNTNLMTNSPAKTYVESLGEGWYLPSIDELSILWHNRFHVNKVLSDTGSTLLSNTAKYWSSTEYNASFAWIFEFNNGFGGGNDKLSLVSVRAIKAF